jgi:hypothetical protein
MAKILYENAEWQVTSRGVRSRGYHIDKDRLGEDCSHRLEQFPDGHAISDWMIHFAESKDYDLDLFADALRRAITIHGVGTKIDVGASLAEARRIRMR